MALGKSIAEIELLPAREVAEWSAFVNIEGLPQDRLEFLIAQETNLLANIHRQQGAVAFKTSDWLPRFRRPAPRRSPGLTDDDLNSLNFFIRLANQNGKSRTA